MHFIPQLQYQKIYEQRSNTFQNLNQKYFFNVEFFTQLNCQFSGSIV